MVIWLLRTSMLVTVTALSCLLPLGVAVAEQKAGPITGIVARGTSVYSHDELAETYKEYFGDTAEREVFEEIRKRIRNQYESDGYARPKIVFRSVPNTDGIYVISVTEPYISAVAFEGDTRVTPTLTRYAEELRESRPLRPDVLHTYLALMQQLSGLEVSPALSKDDEANGGYTLTLALQRKPLEAVVIADNRGDDRIGESIIRAMFETHSVLGAEETLSLAAATSNAPDRYLWLGITGQKPVGYKGTDIGLRLYSSNSDLTDDTDDAEYQRLRGTLFVRHPIHLSLTKQVIADAMLKVYDSDKEVAGAITREENITALELSLKYTGVSSLGRSQFTFAVDKGFDALGSEVLDREALEPADPEYTRVHLSYSNRLTINDNWSLIWDITGQHANDVLPRAERFKVGGPRLGGAYDSAEISGDEGAGTRLTLRRTVPLGSTLRGLAYGYYDIGAVWRNTQRSVRQSAASAGIGVRNKLGPLAWELELAKPLTRVVQSEGNKDARIFLTMSYTFFD